MYCSNTAHGSSSKWLMSTYEGVENLRVRKQMVPKVLLLMQKVLSLFSDSVCCRTQKQYLRVLGEVTTLNILMTQSGYSSTTNRRVCELESLQVVTALCLLPHHTLDSTLSAKLLDSGPVSASTNLTYTLRMKLHSSLNA